MSRFNNVFKKVGLIALGVGAIGIVGLGIKSTVNYFKNDTKTLHLNYEVGNLGTDGKYVNDELALYSNKFACEGLKATLAFDNEINYQFYYYDILDNFVSSSDVLTSGFKAEIPWNAAYSRVVITPTNDEDGKISFMEKHKYGNQLNVSVNKKAESNVNKLFRSIGDVTFRVVTNPLDSKFEFGKTWNGKAFETSSNFSCTSQTILNVNGGEYIKLEYSVFGETIAPNLSMYQYKLNDNNELIFIKNVELRDSTNYMGQLDKECDYVVMNYWSSNENLNDLTPNIQKGLIISNKVID